MSEEKENLQQQGEEEVVYEDEYASFETIFSDPAAHKDEAPKNNGKKRLIALLSGLLAVAVLVGGTLAVIRFIPELQDETKTPAFENITVLSRKTDGISAVTVKNAEGTAKFLPTREETAATASSEATVTTTWSVEGIEAEKTDSDKISAIVDAATTINATRKIDAKTAADCGLNAPKYEVIVSDAEEGDYTVLVGADSPDHSGVYLQLGGEDTIYLVDESAVSAFDFKLLDLADTTAIKGLEIREEMPDYVSDGKLIGFEKLTISGKNFPQPLVMEMNDDGEIASIFSFKITSPVQRIAENVEGVFELFSTGLTVGGAYAYDVSDNSLKSVGLDNPDLVLDMKVGNHRRIYRIAKVDDEYCAVVTGESKMIHKVSNSFLPFLDYTAESFYSKYVYMRSIKELSNMTITTAAGEKYSFDIVYHENNEDGKEYHITSNGQEIETSYFQTFYQELVGLDAADFNTEKVLGTPEATITFTYSADGSKSTITFTKNGETRYQFATDGKAEGHIASSAFVKFMRYAKQISQNQKIK